MKKDKNKVNTKAVKKKYAVAEVEHLKQVNEENLQSLQKQKDRIFELKEQNAKLEAELLEYRNREAHIAKALTYAAEKASEVEEAARKKYSMEIEHLRLFHEKWKNYYNQLIKRYPIDDKIKEIQEFDRKMTKVFAGKEAEAKEISAQSAFEQEKKRVTGKKAAPKVETEEAAALDSTQEEDFVPPTTIKNYLEKDEEILQSRQDAPIKSAGVGRSAIGAKIAAAPIPPSSSGFNLEDALNPKQDLEDIMKELGLSFEGEI